MPKASLVVALVAATALAAERPPVYRVTPPKGYTISSAARFAEGLAGLVYYVDGKPRHGFIDRRGSWVVPPVYEDSGYYCRQGLIRVKRAGRWDVLDREGAFQFHVPGTLTSNFASDRATVVLSGPFGWFARWGYIDDLGKFAIEPRYELAYPFEWGYAAVFAGGKAGLIDPTGKLTIPLAYDHVRMVGPERVAVKDGERWTFLDPHGNRAFRGEFATACFFDDGYGVVRALGDPEGLSTVIDRDGRQHGPKRRGLYMQFAGGLVGFSEGGKAGFQKPDGKIAVQARFDDVSMFSAGLAAVKLGAKWGYIDHTGAMVIPARFDAAGGFAQDLAPVREGQRAGFIDRSGEFRIELGESKVFWGF